MTRNSYYLLRASYLANFAYGLLVPVYAIFVEKIGGNILDAGIAFSIYGICSGGLIILFGSSKFFQDHLKLVIVVGYSIYSLVYFLFIFVASPYQLFLLQVLTGFAAGILEPSWSAVFSARQGEKQLEHNWALWTGGVGIITGIAALLGGIIASYSFKPIFILMGCSTLLSALLVSRILKDETFSQKIIRLMK